jgi:hypothetical protein
MTYPSAPTGLEQAGTQHDLHATPGLGWDAMASAIKRLMGLHATFGQSSP